MHLLGEINLSHNIHYYSDNYNNFDEWLYLISNSKELVYPFCRIPFEEWLLEYTEDIHNRTVKEVKTY